MRLRGPEMQARASRGAHAWELISGNPNCWEKRVTASLTAILYDPGIFVSYEAPEDNTPLPPTLIQSRQSWVISLSAKRRIARLEPQPSRLPSSPRRARHDNGMNRTPSEAQG